MPHRGANPVFIVTFLSYLSRRSFVWSPAIDLSDNAIRSTLLPGSLS